MAHDARPTRRTKDDENNNLKGRQTSGKGSASTNPSPSRKSERLEKRNSTTPAKRTPVRVEKQTVPIPLRRSERSKNPSLSNSSESKKSDKSLSSPDIKRKKEKKEKSVKQLTMETKEVEVSNRSEKRVKRRMSGRAYLELFKDKNVEATGHNEERSNASVSGSTKETLERNVESLKHGSNIETNGPEVLDESDGGDIARELSDNSEQLQLSMKEKLQSPEFLNSTMKGRIPDDDTGVEKDHDAMSLKRKRTYLNMNGDASAMIANKDTGIAHNDATSSPSRCENEICVKTCGSCFKRQRVDNDLTKQEFCSCCQNLQENLDKEDRGELEAVVSTEVPAKSMNHVQQKKSFVNCTANGSTNICFICKLGGYLLCCDGKGCRRSCHLSCLEPPLKDVPLGAWHCSQCIRKKIELGVHSLSEGVESIWDSREEEVSDDSGCRKQRQYFVKYKSCAHVHNRWVSERQLLGEVPSLVAKFNRKNQNVRWKQEWTVPHRLLQRRSLVSPKEHNGSIDNLDCKYEWLVKWCCLGYEHATWELENEHFINTPQGRSLIRDYEDRQKRANRASGSSSLTNKREKGLPDKLSQFSAGFSSGSDNKLDFVNKLREYWYRGQNAVVFDDQERIAKVISFIFSLLSDCCQPFLIISTSAALHLWDEEFLHMAPSAHVVLYCGDREVRKSIRSLEFSEGGGRIMFQVLITSPEVLVEDINVFERIGWEAVVVDECQRSKIFSHFEQIKVLSTDMRLLLVSGQLKDSIAHLKMLSLLDSPSSDNLTIDSNDTIGSLKEKLLKYIAYEGKSDASRFVEYWVPVQISDMQLEQYCGTLLKNSLSLWSPLKSDPVGILRDILNTLRKCCDSPYLVDESLQGLLIKGKETEIVDVGVKASGKLQLLDTMLSEMKNHGLRVLILFQPTQAISGKMGLGDILDDIIRMRFGSDSYERIDGNVRSKEKQIALNKFNKESGRFVFLLETRACLPSITLSSVDTVIIFNSDWSPINDIKALQRITLDPQFEKIKIFRLYSSCTVEEKVLILAKQDKTPDGYLQNTRPSTSHLLLMWGASHLFDRLKEFHGGNTPASSTSNFLDQSFWKDVVQEFITILTQTGEDDTDTSKFNKILEAKQNLGIYSSDFPLYGESETEVMDEGLAHIFWKNLLEGKRPCWKYSSGSTPRSRKRVQHFDDLQKKLDAENDEVVKKHRKVTSSSVHPSSSKPGVETKIPSRDKKGSSGIQAHSETTYLNHDSTSPCLVNNILEVPKELCDSQESFYLLLKPEMAKLCEVLKLNDDAKSMVEKFLEYVMNNHHVNREQPTIVQAFQISLCWTVASLMKQKIDHKESLALAKKYLNFGCNKDEVDLVYSKLRCLKDIFLDHIKKLELKNYSKASELFLKDVSKDNLQARPSQSKTSDLQRVNIEDDDRSTGKECSYNLEQVKLAQKDIIKSIKKIKKKCSKLMVKAQQKLQVKKEGIERKYEEENAQLENKKRTEVAIIRLQSHGNTSMLTDRLKNLDNEYAKQFEERQRGKDIQLKNLETMIEVEVKKVRQKEASWMEEINSWLLAELLHEPPLNKSTDAGQCLETNEQVDADDSHESIVPASSHYSESPSPNAMLMRGAGGIESPVVHETLGDGAEACGNRTETVTRPVSHRSVRDELDTVASAQASVSRLERDIRVGSLGAVQKTAVSINLGSVEQIPGRTMSSLADGQIRAKVNELVSSSDGPGHGLSPVFSSEEQIYNGARLSPGGEIPRGVTETVSLSEGLESVVPVNAPSSEKQVPDNVEKVPDDAVLLEIPETGSSSDGPQTIIAVDFPASGVPVPDQTELTEPENVHSGDNLENDSENLFSSRDQIPDAEALVGNLQNGCSEPTTLTVPDEEVMLQVPENVSAGDILENNSFNLSSSREQIHDSTTGMPDVEALSGSLRDGCSEPVTGTCDGDAAVSGMQSDATEPLTQPRLLISIDSPSGHNPTCLPSVSEVEHQPSSGHYIADQITRAPTTVVENHVELSDLASLPAASFVTNSPVDIPIDGLGTTTSDLRISSVNPGYSNHTVQNVYPGVTHPGASQFSVPMYRDPLQKELDRLRKETEETIKNHEETKLRLKSDCDQEIETIVTQIRRKYEIKLQETEAEFFTKTRELEANQSKVYMNKILADAFRSKCMDPKQSNVALQQDFFSSSIPQRARLPSQHFAQRSSALAGPSSSCPPTAAQQTTVAPTVSLQTSLPVVSPHTGVRPVQAVLHSAALFSSTPLTRPSHSSSLTSPAGNHHIGSGLSAPPHLRPFRPSSMVSCQPIPTNSPAATPLLPRLPTQTPLPAYQPPAHNRPHPGNPSAGVSSLLNPSLSALELLMDVSNRSGANPIPPSSLPPQSNLHSNLGPSAQPESGQRSGKQPNPVQNNGASDVVCLSDDE